MAQDTAESQLATKPLVYFEEGSICMTGGVSTLVYISLTFLSLMCIIVANQITNYRQKEA